MAVSGREPPRLPTSPPLADESPPARGPSGDAAPRSPLRWMVPTLIAVAVVALGAVLLIGGGGGGAPEPGDEATPTTGSTEAGEVPASPPESAPGPDTPVPADLERAIEQARDFVAGTRGRDFRGEVAVRVLEPGVFEARAEERLEPEAVQEQAALFAAVGLIEPEAQEQYVDEILAWHRSRAAHYDAAADELLVARTEVTVDARRAIVHELVRALDDQLFELHRPDAAAEPTTELGDTLPALAAGDANRVEAAWLETLGAAEREAAGDSVGGTAQLTASEGTVDYELFSTQRSGLSFAEALAEAGGEELIDASFVDPPETTEQVLFPEVFLRGEGRVRVPAPAAGEELVGEGVVGAAWWLQVLLVATPDLTVEEAERAVRGWGGDWQVAWAEDELTCTRTDVVGDTAEDTLELLDALTRWAEANEGVAVSEAEGRVRVEYCIPPPASGGSNV